ncbi:sigma-70 family RNA polymerase sigma factor [Paenibacillus thermoaerophilus]|nr:sigma-70 family RNA polymerase sigma factor [Paenibacillus thermoaerophilus]
MKDNLRRLLDKEFFSLDVSLQKQVYADFYRLAYRFSMNIAKDHGTAEEVAQETFLKALRHPPGVDSEAQFVAWVKVVARNLTRNAIRQRNKFRLGEDLEGIAARLSCHKATTEQRSRRSCCCSMFANASRR